jgi:hypothetical protein
MRDKVKSVRKIKADGISLMLTAGNRSQKVKKRHQIGNSRFSPGEAMLIGIKFSIMQNKIMNEKFKQFREIIENRNGSVVAHFSMIDSCKYRYNSSFFPYNRKILLS